MKTKRSKFDPSTQALGSLYWQNKSVFLTQDFLRLISQIFISLFPLFIGQIATSEGDNNKLLWGIIFLAGASFVHTVMWNIADVVAAKYVNPRIYQFREYAFKYAWGRDYPDFVKTPSGKSASTISRTYQNIEVMYDSYVYQLFPVLISLPIYLIILINLNLVSFFMFFAFLIFMLVAMRPLINRVIKSRVILSDIESTEDARVFDSFSNFVNIFSFRAINKERKIFKVGNSDLTKARVRFGLDVTYFWAATSLAIRGALWAIVLAVNYYLYTNDKISFQELVISVSIMIEFTNQFWGAIEFYGFFVEKLSAYKTNYNYLFEGRNIVKEHFALAQTDSTRDSAARSDGESLNLAKSISFSNLNFAYPDRADKDVLKNINLEITKGEKIGVVGKSGSGKSTLVKILLGFYDIVPGTISVDGKNVAKEELSLLNCYVPQDTTLFQQSVEYNIAYAKNSEVSHDEIVVAAKKAHAHEFILNLNYGYETLVGERGIKLSLGQRQRIALARAFLKDSQLLILDEATSSLDSKTEALVQESLEELWKNRTVVAVAHRLSTLNNVDRIIVIDKGEIVEQGSKTELLAMNGIFTELWNHQANGMIIEDNEDEIEEV